MWFYSEPVLNRCIPSIAVDLSWDIIREFYRKLNDIELLKLALADIANVWSEIVLLCLLSLG